MNRSFRAPEPQMGATMAPLQRGRSLGAVIKEKDEELALFLEMRKREKDRNDSLLLDSTDDFDPPPGSKPGSSPIFKIVSSAPSRKTGPDDFLNSDSDKNDYDWLLTPPGTPLFPSLEKESNRSPTGLNGTPKSRPTVLKSRLANPSDPPTRGSSLSRQPISSSSTSAVGIRRPSSSGGPGSGSSRLSGGTGSVSSRSGGPGSVTSRTSGGPGSVSSRPTGGPASVSSRPSGGPGSVTSRPSGGPGSVTSRPSGGPGSVSSRPATPTSRSTIPATAKSSRPSTPTSRATLPAKPVAHPRPSTPSRSATPTSRPSLAPPSKPTSRAATPTRRPSTPSNITSNSAPPSRSSSVARSATVNAKASAPARSSSPSVKSRPWKPSEMPGFSLDAPPNLRTSMPERPTSASRGRPGAPSSRSSSVDPGPANRPRRQSCSPSRGRTPNGSVHSGSSVPAVGRSHLNGSDNVNPVLIGTKMVERVVNLRRLAPPKQDNPRSSYGNGAGKSSSSPDSSGFGRTLSKKSLDMALRHMDIRQSIPNNLRPLMTNIPASSMYSVRPGSARSRGVSALDSPLATSSNCSSEQSVSNNNLCLEGSEVGDEDIRSER